MLTIRNDYEKARANIVGTLRRYLFDNPKLRSLVLGVSGGIDSALTAALAREALASVPGVELIGRMLVIETNTPEEIARGERVGRAFCHRFETLDLTGAYRDLYLRFVAGTDRPNSDAHAEKIRRGNLKTRVRMALLFDLAHLEQGMVLSTDNLTEQLIGFWTLHGDVGNYGLIQNLWKTEVYGLSRHLAAECRRAGRTDQEEALALCIEALPTDGLGITRSDFDQIGVSDYAEVDAVLIDYLKGNGALESHPVIVRHKGSAFKRVDPQSIPRETIFK